MARAPALANSHVYFFAFVWVCLLLHVGYVALHRGQHPVLSTLVAWSFFVLCTPLPEAGVVVDLPLKWFFDISMVTSQCVISAIAVIITYYAITHHPALFDTSSILREYRYLLRQSAIPIFILSGIGTYSGLLVLEWWVLRATTTTTPAPFPKRSGIVCVLSIVVYAMYRAQLMAHEG